MKKSISFGDWDLVPFPVLLGLIGSGSGKKSLAEHRMLRMCFVQEPEQKKLRNHSGSEAVSKLDLLFRTGSAGKGENEKIRFPHSFLGRDQGEGQKKNAFNRPLVPSF